MRRLALFFTFFIAAMCIQGQEIEIPAWVDHEVNETFARFNEWRGDDQVVVFPIQTFVAIEFQRLIGHVGFLTDLHHGIKHNVFLIVYKYFKIFRENALDRL